MKNGAGFLLVLYIFFAGCGNNEDTAEKIARIFERHAMIEVSAGDIKTAYIKEGISGLQNFDKYCAIVGIKRRGAVLEQIPDKSAERSAPLSRYGDNKTGYARIPEFSPGISASLREKLDIFRKNGINGIIIDLRHNKGGKIEEVVESLKLFIGGGAELFHTASRQKGYSAVYKSGGSAFFNAGAVLIFTDGETASGAEIFAASLRENIKARLLGEKTAGRAYVQKVFRLSKKRGLSLTVCELLPPSGKKIEGTGLDPDGLIENVSWDIKE